MTGSGDDPPRSGAASATGMDTHLPPVVVVPVRRRRRPTATHGPPAVRPVRLSSQ